MALSVLNLGREVVWTNVISPVLVWGKVGFRRRGERREDIGDLGLGPSSRFVWSREVRKVSGCARVEAGRS